MWASSRSAPQQSGGAERQRQQQEAERHRRRPGWPVERRGDALDHTDQKRRNQRAGKAAETAKNANGKHASDIFAPDRWLDRLKDNKERTRYRRGRDRDAEGNALDANRVGGHQRQRALDLRYRKDRASGERAADEKLQCAKQRQRDQKRHQDAQREVDETEAQSRSDIGRLDVAVIDPESEDQHDLGNKQYAKEEGEATQRFGAALFE